MTDRDAFSEDLKAYLDNELPLLRRWVLRRHLAGCRYCREELMQMTQVTDRLRADAAQDMGASAPDLDPTLRDTIIGGAVNTERTTMIGGHGMPANKIAARPPTNRRLVVGLGLAASAVILLAVIAPVFMQAREKARSVYTHDAPVPWMSGDQQYAAAPMPAPERPATPGGGNQGHAIVVHDAAREVKNMLVSGKDDTPTAADTSDRRVHKEATITVEVLNPEEKGDQIQDLVKAAGGFVAANTLATGDDDLKTANLTVKVPVAQFETILGQIAHLGEVKAKNISGEDITEKVSDAGQKENVLEDEVNRADARLKELGKHAKWDESETARDLRIQLAESRARLVLLKKLGELSEITVTLTEKPKAVPPPSTGFLSGMNDTTRSAFGSLMSSVGAVLSFVIWTLAYAPIWIPLLLIGRWLYRRYAGQTSVG